jgi:hypothetical protein
MTTVNIDKTVTTPPGNSIIAGVREGLQNGKASNTPNPISLLWRLCVWYALAARDIGWGFLQIFTCPLTAETIKQKDFEYWKVIPVSAAIWTMMTCFLLAATMFFYSLVQFRIDRGDWSATKKYARAAVSSTKSSDKFMCYSQDIQDKYTNDKDQEVFEVHPIWYMSNFPDDIEPEAARVNYCRVMQEEGWSMYGPMGPRLSWANQFQRRVQVIYAHKRDWNTDLGRNYEWHEYRDQQTKKPSWYYSGR